MSNTHEESMFPKGMTEEEAALLSDEEIMKILIAEKRTKIERQRSIQQAGIRRRRAIAAATTTKVRTS